MALFLCACLCNDVVVVKTGCGLQAVIKARLATVNICQKHSQNHLPYKIWGEGKRSGLG